MNEPYVDGIGLMRQPPGCSDFSCPGPKYNGITCDSLSIKPEETYFVINIFITRLAHVPPCYNNSKEGPQCPETEQDPPNRRLLVSWLNDLFTKYDLRSIRDSSIHIPPPSGADIGWSYGNYWATEKTILSLVQERYIDFITIYDIRNRPTISIHRTFNQAKNLKYKNGHVLINGRELGSKSQSEKTSTPVFGLKEQK
jgi:hypothetical protein